MSNDELPEHIKKFIFEFIDSVELLDVLLLMSADRQKTWTPADLSGELRANINSVQLRLAHLKNCGIIEEVPVGSEEYRYASQISTRDAIIQELFELNRTKRHRILRLIFSPLKQIRVLADGFRVSSKKPKGGPNDG